MARLTLFGIWIICVIGSVVAATWMLCALIVGSDRAWDIAIAFDRVVNVATGGKNTETVSSRAERARSEGTKWGCVLCKFLDRLQPNHCADSAGE